MPLRVEEGSLFVFTHIVSATFSDGSLPQKPAGHTASARFHSPDWFGSLGDLHKL